MDGLDIEIEGDSEPAVALALLKIVMRAEGKDEGGASADWILSDLRPLPRGGGRLRRRVRQRCGRG